MASPTRHLPTDEKDLAMHTLWSKVGAMRVVLLACTAALLPFSFFSDAQPTGFGVFRAYIAPTVVVLLFFVLLLDALMNRVFMAEQTEAGRRAPSLRLRLDLLAVGLLILFWGPFFYRLVALYSGT